jgi:predicted esterase
LPITVFAGEGTELKPQTQFSASARLGWTDEGLVTRVRVIDATPFEADREERLYEGDSVELVLSLPGQPGDMIQLIASPGRTPEHPRVRTRLFDYRGTTLKERTAPTGRAIATSDARRYTIEMVLPWKNLGVEPKDGLVVGARIGVNDGEPNRPRTRLTWLGSLGEYRFLEPGLVRLANRAAPVKEVAVWADYSDDLSRTAINVVADRSYAGQKVEVQAGDQTLSTKASGREGEVAVARMDLDVPPAGQIRPGLSVRIAGTTRKLALPDIEERRKGAFFSGADSRPFSRASWAYPDFQTRAFTGNVFPAFDYPDRAKVERMVGPVTFRTAFYDAAGQAVTEARAPGRYGAVTTVSAANGLSYTSYRTLFRVPEGQSVPADAIAAAAQFEGKSFTEKADRDYWHSLRKRLGTAIAYETYVKLPAGYEQDPTRRWPLIVYLHGSGGGNAESWDTVKVADGPQAPAHSLPGFPFIVVSLRSPGGWMPPAVHDALDAVEAKYRIDKDRVYLTGFSMGGIGTWNVAYDRPDRFAAIAPVGGRSGDAKLMPLLKSVPTWVFNGAEDTATTAEDARAAVKSLREAGGQVEYTEYPKAGHMESLQYAYRGQDLYDWFLKHRRGLR